MYKINVTNKFMLYKFVYGKGNVLLGEYKDVYDLLAYNKKELNNALLISEVMQALEYMHKMNHDTAEFGVRGYFTISYNEEENVQTNI